MNRVAVSIPEAAALLGIGKNTAYEAARRGEIPTLKIGRRLLVPMWWLRALERGDGPASHGTAAELESALPTGAKTRA